MTTHSLKVWPEPFAALAELRKTAEFRRDDRGFSVGDTLELEEWRPDQAEYTGRVVTAIVSHVTRGPHVPEGYAMLSLAGVSIPTKPSTTKVEGGAPDA